MQTRSRRRQGAAASEGAASKNSQREVDELERRMSSMSGKCTSSQLRFSYSNSCANDMECFVLVRDPQESRAREAESLRKEKKKEIIETKRKEMKERFPLNSAKEIEEMQKCQEECLDPSCETYDFYHEFKNENVFLSYLRKISSSFELVNNVVSAHFQSLDSLVMEEQDLIS